jgi:hypothetical protein
MLPRIHFGIENTIATMVTKLGDCLTNMCSVLVMRVLDKIGRKCSAIRSHTTTFPIDTFQSLTTDIMSTPATHSSFAKHGPTAHGSVGIHHGHCTNWGPIIAIRATRSESVSHGPSERTLVLES